MQEEKVRIGLVGVGWFGGARVDSARKSGAAEIVSCFARAPEHRDAFAAKHGCRAAESFTAMLDDPEVEAILIATPHSTHIGLVEEAASAGKHVFVEKPLVLSAADARRAAEVTEKANVVLQVGHNSRRQPANRRIKAMLDGGELGTVLHLDGVHMSPSASKPDIPAWRLDPAECPAGGMTALGVHTVDTFQYLAGPAKRLVAFSKQVMGRTKLDEATSILIEYERGPVGAITTSYFARPIVSLGVYGTDGSAWNEQAGTQLFVQKVGEATRSPLDVETIDTLTDELTEFARCVRSGTKPETGAPEALEVAAVLEAIVESATSGRAVELADIR